MEKTFESEAEKIHSGFEEARKTIEMNLTVRYDPAHRIRTRALIGICNTILRCSGSDFRVTLQRTDSAGE